MSDLPSGWTAIPDEPNAAQLPPGWTLKPDSAPQYETPGLEQIAHASYKGSILPISVDTQGKTSFDLSAGLPGMAGRAIQSLADAAVGAVKGPYDAYNGKLPTYSPATETTPGGWNPAAIDRGIDFQVLSPVGAAARVEMTPGMLAKTLAAPSAQELKRVGGAGYDAARATDLQIHPDSVATMAESFKNAIQSEKGIIPATAPQTFATLDELTKQPAASPGTRSFVTIPGLEAARSALSTLSTGGGTEGLAAGRAVRHIDDFLGSLTPKDVVGGTAPAEDVAAILRNARANYAAAQRSNDLTGTLDRANTGILEQAQNRAAAANSGMNLDNNIRQRVASFLQQPRNVAGFSDQEIEALNNVVQGSRTQNFLRETGNMLGGGGRWGRTLISGLGGMLGARYGMEGAGLGAAAGASVGKGIKAIENALAERRLNAVDDLVRQRSPLYQQMEAFGPQPSAIGNRTIPLAVRGTVLSGQPTDEQNQMAPGLARILAVSSAFPYGMGMR